MFALLNLVFLCISAAESAQRRMQHLENLGLDLDLNMPKLDFVATLRHVETRTPKELRYQIFVTAQERNLAHRNDVVVERSDSSLRLATCKLAEDVWYLITSVHMKKSVPRLLLKAGKHYRQNFEAQREKNKPQKDPTADMSNTGLSDVPPLSTNSSDCPTSSPCVGIPTPWLTLPNAMAQFTVAADFRKLK